MDDKENYPSYFYKYMSVKNNKDPNKCPVIKSFLKNKAKFSRRTNFNDPFDSQIKFIETSAMELKLLKKRVTIKKNKNELNLMFKNGEITQHGKSFLFDLKVEFNKCIDRYHFYCVSGLPNSNLMWSHYSHSYTGFCIQLKSDSINADRMTYQSDLPSINLIDLVELTYNHDITLNRSVNPGHDSKLGKQIWKSLKIKLKEWSYEQEYRLLPKDFLKEEHQYPDNSVVSIIFGHRMNDCVRDYLISESLKIYPSIKFKITKPSINSGKIEIVDYKS